MSDASRFKALVFLNNIVPYHDVRWRSAAPLFSQCLVVETTNCDEFKALEFQQESAESYQRVTLFPHRSRKEVSKRQLAREVRRVLAQERPDVLFVNGYSFFYNWIALKWGLRHQIPVVICSESNEHDEPRQSFKEGVKRFFVSRCAAGLAGGTSQADYLEKLGLPRERLFTGYDVVDNSHFESESMKVRKLEGETRKNLGLPDRYFFACARFGKKKNIPGLIKAFSKYREKALRDSEFGIRDSGLNSGVPTPLAPKGTALQSNQLPPVAGFKSQVSSFASSPCDLVIAGDGEERPFIEQMLRESGVAQHVHLIGPKSYDQLPSYYGLAEAFIHASTTEQWGLVVNEAMASGLPVLVSNRCGCVPDLVQEGVNGWAFDPGDQAQLANLMVKIASDSQLRKQLGAKSREIIANWGPTRFSEGVSSAVGAAMCVPKPKYGLIERLMFTLMSLR